MHKAGRFAIEEHAITRPLLRWLQVLSGSAIVVFALTPPHWIERGPELCPFRRLFGISCYGCGMTRALAWLLHGKLDLALAYNRGSVATLVLLAAFAVSALWFPRRGRTG